MAILKIYKTNLDPTRNMVLDNIEDYLTNVAPQVYTDNNFQFIRPALQQTIKINAESFYNNNISLIKMANFLSITEKATNSEDAQTVTYYYFIMGAEWVADGTCRLTIALDTLNTWWDDIKSNITNKTHITREHKDRFGKKNQEFLQLEYDYQGYFTPNSPNSYTMNVELQDDAWIGASQAELITMNTNRSDLTGTFTRLNETFNSNTGTYSFTLRYVGSINNNPYLAIRGDIQFGFPQFYYRKIDKFSEGLQPITFGENKGEVEQDNTWYLVYTKTKLQACPKTPVKIRIPGKQEYTHTDFTTNNYYYIVPEYTGEDYIYCVVKADTGTEYIVQTKGDLRTILQLQATSNGFRIRLGQRMKNAIDPNVGFPLWQECTSITISGSGNIRFFESSTDVGNINTIYQLPEIIKTISATLETIYSIDNLNRTDNNLIKIIELPYAPFEGLTARGWSYDSTNHMLETNYDIGLESRIESSYKPLGELKVDLSSITKYDNHNAKYESKLYHSDFYQPKFVYDSFNKVFALERQNINRESLYAPFRINFKATNTINSRFLFDFTKYDTNGQALEDYENILVVNRNNELPIYNNEYFNYLRAGYNYDQKAKVTQGWTAAGSAAVSLAGSAASIGIAASMGGASAGVAGMVIGAAVGVVGAIISITSQTHLQANSIQQKEAQYANQAMSVRGCDDIDLLNYYSNNKAKMMLYKPSEQMENALYNMFRLTGYATDNYDIPDFDSRIWYNFVQCEPVFNNNNSEVYNDFIDDIKARFQMGVTVFHKDATYGSWDLTQEKENYEAFLFN